MHHSERSSIYRIGFALAVAIGLAFALLLPQHSTVSAQGFTCPDSSTVFSATGCLGVPAGSLCPSGAVVGANSACSPSFCTYCAPPSTTTPQQPQVARSITQTCPSGIVISVAQTCPSIPQLTTCSNGVKVASAAQCPSTAAIAANVASLTQPAPATTPDMTSSTATTTTTPAPVAPPPSTTGTCYAGDSWCTYCNNHADADLCVEFPPAHTASS